MTYYLKDKLSLSPMPDIECQSRNRKTETKTCNWKGDEGENQNSHCSLSILIFCLAGIWQIPLPGTSACSLIILQIYLWEDLSGPLSFMDIAEVSVGEHTFLRVSQDLPLVSYLSDFGCLKSESHSVVSDSLQPHGLYSPWNSPDQNTGVGSQDLFNPGIWEALGRLRVILNFKQPKMFYLGLYVCVYVHHGLTVCVTPNLHVEILTSNMMVLGGKVLGKVPKSWR